RVHLGREVRAGVCADGEDRLTAGTGLAVDAHAAGVWVEEVEPVPGSSPEPPHRILVECVHGVAAQALGVVAAGAVMFEPARRRIQPVDASEGPHPDGAAFVLDQAGDGVIGQALWVAGDVPEALDVVPRATDAVEAVSVRARPDVAAAVLDHGPDVFRGKPTRPITRHRGTYEGLGREVHDVEPACHP